MTEAAVWTACGVFAAMMGGYVVDHYAALLKEREATPCTPDEQKYGEPLCAGCGKPNSECSCCRNCGHPDCDCDHERFNSDPAFYD